MRNDERLAALLVIMSCVGCSGAAAPPPEPRPTVQAEPEPEGYPARTPTPTGIVGAIVDHRATLPEGYESIPTTLEPEQGAFHRVPFGPGAPTMRFLSWQALPLHADTDERAVFAGWAVELVENPGLDTITWETLEDRGTEVDLRVRYEHIDARGSLVGGVVEGTVDARSGSFTPTN